MQEHPDLGRTTDANQTSGQSRKSSASCSSTRTTACKATARRKKATIIPTGTHQSRHINAQTKRALTAGTPVVSIDTKKKELLGKYENHGRQWLPAKDPLKVNGHDFPDPDVPRAYPYGVS